MAERQEQLTGKRPPHAGDTTSKNDGKQRGQQRCSMLSILVLAHAIAGRSVCFEIPANEGEITVTASEASSVEYFVAEKISKH